MVLSIKKLLIDSARIDFIQLALRSPFSTDYLFSQVKSTKIEYTGWGISDRLGEITLPSMVIWGKHDGIMPVALAYDCFNGYGSPAGDKYLEICQYSAHSPHFEEPITFAAKVDGFVKHYKLAN